MSLFQGYLFFALLAVAVIPAAILGICEKPIRNYAFGASLFFVITALSCKPIQLLFFALYYCWQLAAVKFYLKLNTKYGRNAKIYYAMLIFSLTPLIIEKFSKLFGLSLFAFIGISYLTFKTVQIIIEIYDGLIDKINTYEFSCFMVFFPTFSSGPIDRSRRFSGDFHLVIPRSEYLEMFGTGLFKILVGLIYKLIISVAFYKLMLMVDAMDTWYGLLAYAYAYGFYMFFDFAGYSLMAIGTAYIFGIKTPDNFNAPFIASDIKDFWNRWHITLSHWFRDFVFSRIVMKFTRKKWFGSKLNRASVAFIVNMSIMGAWHGLTASYLLYGLYHGLLLAGTEIFQKKSAIYKKYKNTQTYKAVSWFLTLQLVMFGFLIFSGKLLQG